MRLFFFVLGLLLILAVGPVSGAALAAPGDLDLEFGVGGIVYSDLASVPDTLTVLPDGRLFALYGLTFRCYGPNGVLDPTFGVDPGSGTQTDIVPAVNLERYGVSGQPWTGVRVQPGTGRILVWQAGRRWIGVVYSDIVGIAALTSNGLLDTSFGDGGFLTTPEPDASLYVPISIDMAADGSLVVGAYAYANGGDVVVFRYTPDGRLDSSFGSGGVWTRDFANQSVDIVGGVGALSGGRTLLYGSIEESTAFWMRLLPDGTPDPSFHDGGLWIIRWGEQSNAVGLKDARVVELADGSMIVVPLGFGYGGSFYRMHPNCTEDKAYPRVFKGRDGGVLLNDNSIVVTGCLNSGYPTYRDFFVRRYTSAWLPDETFAPKGVVVKDFGTAGDAATAVVLPDGKVIVGGVNTGSISGTSAVGGVPAATGARSAAVARGILFRLMGGSLTNLPTKLARRGRSSVSRVMRAGRAKWTTTAKLTCNGTPVGNAKVRLKRSRNARSWSAAATVVTRRGTATATMRFSRKGTYFFRWSFAGTKSYRKATAAITKVIVK